MWWRFLFLRLLEGKFPKKYSVGSFLNTVYHRPGGEWTLERRNCEIFKSTKYSVGMSWNFFLLNTVYDEPGVKIPGKNYQFSMLHLIDSLKYGPALVKKNCIFRIKFIFLRI